MDWEIVIIVLITALVTLIIPTIFELRKNLKKISILIDNINDEHKLPPCVVPHRVSEIFIGGQTI